MCPAESRALYVEELGRSAQRPAEPGPAKEQVEQDRDPPTTSSVTIPMQDAHFAFSPVSRASWRKALIEATDLTGRVPSP